MYWSLKCAKNYIIQTTNNKLVFKTFPLKMVEFPQNKLVSSYSTAIGQILTCGLL